MSHLGLLSTTGRWFCSFLRSGFGRRLGHRALIAMRMHRVVIPHILDVPFASYSQPLRVHHLHQLGHGRYRQQSPRQTLLLHPVKCAS